MCHQNQLHETTVNLVPRYLAVSALCMMLNVGLLISFARIGVHYVISVLVFGGSTDPHKLCVAPGVDLSG